jgi:hypothetical protein
VRFVKVEPIEDGFWLDPAPYLEELKRIAESLPSGARAFATDPEHYNFFSERCVKDLKLRALTTVDADGVLSAEAAFEFNDVAPEWLVIAYRDVVSLRVDVDDTGPDEYPPSPETRRLSDVQLDEILPHDHGCSHEIQMINGVIAIVCADLVATWVPAR